MQQLHYHSTKAVSTMFIRRCLWWIVVVLNWMDAKVSNSWIVESLYTALWPRGWFGVEICHFLLNICWLLLLRERKLLSLDCLVYFRTLFLRYTLVFKLLHRWNLLWLNLNCRGTCVSKSVIFGSINEIQIFKTLTFILRNSIRMII